MRNMLAALCTLCVLATSGSACAQVAGVVDLWGDAGWTQCNLTQPAGLITIYVTHSLHDGATAVQYTLSENTGGALSHLADVNQFTLVLGDSQTGVAVSYGGCLQGEIHVQSVLYEVLSDPPVCTRVQVVAHPGAPSGEIESVDCDSVKRFPSGEMLTFSADGSCPCGHDPAVETSTWGRVKGLYR